MRRTSSAGPTVARRDIASGGGVPRWLASTLNYCSNCGGAAAFGEVAGEDRHRLACADCGHIAYVNPRLVVTTLPVTDDGELVLLRRGIEPGRRAVGAAGRLPRGRRDRPPGGDPRDAGRRPGSLVEPGEIIGLYTRLEAAVVTIAFEARIVGGTAAPTPEALEIEAFAPGRDPVAGARVQDDDVGAPRLARSRAGPTLTTGRSRSAATRRRRARRPRVSSGR